MTIHNSPVRAPAHAALMLDLKLYAAGGLGAAATLVALVAIWFL